MSSLDKIRGVKCAALVSQGTAASNYIAFIWLRDKKASAGLTTKITSPK